MIKLFTKKPQLQPQHSYTEYAVVIRIFDVIGSNVLEYDGDTESFREVVTKSKYRDIPTPLSWKDKSPYLDGECIGYLSYGVTRYLHAVAKVVDPDNFVCDKKYAGSKCIAILQRK